MKKETFYNYSIGIKISGLIASVFLIILSIIMLIIPLDWYGILLGTLVIILSIYIIYRLFCGRIIVDFEKKEIIIRGIAFAKIDFKSIIIIYSKENSFNSFYHTIYFNLVSGKRVKSMGFLSFLSKSSKNRTEYIIKKLNDAIKQ